MKRLIIIGLIINIFFLDIKGDSELKFNNNKKFKIVQFTDIHWKPGSGNCSKVTNLMTSVLVTEKPDLVILTGDIVDRKPIKQGWLEVTKPLIDSKTPWAVTFGNHEEDQDLTRDQIMDILVDLPYNVSQRGPKSISGCSNYILPIKSSSHSDDAAIIYLFDSHNDSQIDYISGYDWIKKDQIDWYLKNSKKFFMRSESPIPSLSFFHIPIPEYNSLIQGKNFIGSNSEDVCCPSINSGLFTAFITMQDVMGVFTGHDHNNDFIGCYHNIALAYGRHSGYDAYGDKKKGARVIVLHEDQFAFDSWIRTVKRKEQVYKYPWDQFKDIKSLKPIDISDVKKGVKYRYYEGKFKRVNSISKTEIKHEGIVDCFTTSPAKRYDFFGLEYSCYLKIETSSIYKISTNSDDGSVLYINNHKIVDNDETHSRTYKEGVVKLEKGYYCVKLKYFNNRGGKSLDVKLVNVSTKVELKIEDYLFY